MAERRMFSKKIIDSDDFLDMPLSAQCLYFHLSMRADDDGFVNNQKKIKRMIGASDDDLKLLIAKSYLIPFESGIVVIKHWHVHNLIRNDRKKETMYIEEKSQLETDSNAVYKLTETIWQPVDNQMTTNCQPNDNQLTTKCPHRIGKDRIGKDRIGKDNRVDYDGIVNAYHSICVSFPTVRTLSDARKKAIKARLNTYSAEEITEAFKIAEKSDFLKGKNNRNWQANFDWMLKDANLAKILDGNYNNKSNGFSAEDDDLKGIL